jgi:hypothetical protein
MFQAYHGVTGNQHQQNFDSLSAQGFRMISLSVYGDPSDARYAAVWVQRQGTAWVAVHGVDSAGYQSFFNNWTAKGFVPVIVSATGGSSNAIFAAVFEQGISGAWMARHGMTSGPDTHVGTFQNLNKTARNSKMILRSVATYGIASDQRYAAVWHANPRYLKWHVHPSDTGASYQVAFNAETQLPGVQLHAYRPAYVTFSGDQTYCSVFKDDVVGPWVARHGMTSSDYQTEFDKQNAAGFYPICVQGGGAGSNTRYAAIFAKQDIPLSRQLASQRTNDEAITEDEGLGLSPLDLNSQLLVPSVYGGDGEINEVGDPNAGTGASAHALTQFIHLHAVWGNGPRAAGYARSGSTPGASSLAVSRGDGVDWAYVINTRDWPPSTSPTLDDLGNSITHILDTTTIP